MVELLVVIVLIAVVGAIVLPTVVRTRRGEGAGKVHCASQLAAIYKAMYLYSNDNKGKFPRTLYVPDGPPTFHWDNSAGRAPVNPFVSQPWAAYPNDVTMAMFLLLRTQDITPEVFICPSTTQAADTFGAGGAANKASFSGPANLSYSFANMYPGAAAHRDGYKWDNAAASEFAIGADLNPGIGDGQDVTAPADAMASSNQMKRANSLNHAGAGQNILYGDGHLNFEVNPFQGTKRDNVYTASGSTDGSVTTSKVVVGLPAWAGDSVLLPVRK
jgi:hypothetical protein